MKRSFFVCVFILTTLMSYGQIVGGSAKIGASSSTVSFLYKDKNSVKGTALTGGIGLEYALIRRLFLEASLQFEYNIFRTEEKNNQILKSVTLPIALGYRWEASPRTNYVFKFAFWGNYWLSGKKEAAELLKVSSDEFDMLRYTSGYSFFVGYEKRSYFLEVGISGLDRSKIPGYEGRQKAIVDHQLFHVNIGRNF